MNPIPQTKIAAVLAEIKATAGDRIKIKNIKQFIGSGSV